MHMQFNECQKKIIQGSKKPSVLKNRTKLSNVLLCSAFGKEKKIYLEVIRNGPIHNQPGVTTL